MVDPEIIGKGMGLKILACQSHVIYGILHLVVRMSHYRHTTIIDMYVPGRFVTLAVWPNFLNGRFETSIGFKTAWPFRNLVSK